MASLRGESRVTRRKLLIGAGTGGLGLTALALVGCGDDDDDDQAESPTSEATAPEQTDGSPEEGSTVEGEPTSGGTFSAVIPAPPDSIDPNVETGAGRALMAGVYSSLFLLSSGPDVENSLEIAEDVVDSYEVSDDGLTYTFSLKQNVRFHPPLDRIMTAEDVVFSFQRFFGETGGVEASKNLARLDFIGSVEATDEFTVVVSLTAPYTAFPTVMADSDLIVILPVEAGESIDLTETMVGTGPWVLEEYTSGVGAQYSRHESWHLGPERPYFDGLEISVVPEPATRTTQFLAGNLDFTDAQGQDIVRIAEENPDAQLHQVAPTSLSFIGFQGRTPDVPWLDERVRQAISVALDRDALLEASYGLTELESAEVPVTRSWHTQIPWGLEGWWLDPQGEEMDPEAARLYQYDPDFARELLADAGYPDGFEAPLNVTTEAYGQSYDIMSELIVQYLAEVGINLELVVTDYSSVFVPQVARGDYEGMHFIPLNRAHPLDFLVTQFAPDSSRNHLKPDDPEIASTLTAIREAERVEEQQQVVRDFQNYLTLRMYAVPMVQGAGPTYLAYQSNMRNVLEHQTIGQTGQPKETWPYYWKAT